MHVKIDDYNKVNVVFANVYSEKLNDGAEFKQTEQKIKAIESAIPFILSKLANELTTAAYSQQSREVIFSKEAEKLKKNCSYLKLNLVWKMK
ncbi:hypothetical protein [Niabella ginsengisoli]|uniref:Uncharacterized protein n=1 Tax=Niabella ginsengisoli TaxID=522298 RepID=A0ABS9SLI4_9BACT|nr:hypothetical protein [Niabella ginsengisoli]MCH5599229.1 hypothetical protein [Niabella ginsengisoli]